MSTTISRVRINGRRVLTILAVASAMAGLISGCGGAQLSPALPPGVIPYDRDTEGHCCKPPPSKKSWQVVFIPPNNTKALQCKQSDSCIAN